jgi:hypothetical protein
MSLLVIDFTYLEGRDGEIFVKELAAVDFHTRRVSLYIFKRSYGWEELPQFNAGMNEVITHGCNWNDGDTVFRVRNCTTSRGIICCSNLLLWTSENNIY